MTLRAETTALWKPGMMLPVPSYAAARGEGQSLFVHMARHHLCPDWQEDSLQRTGAWLWHLFCIRLENAGRGNKDASSVTDTPDRLYSPLCVRQTRTQSSKRAG